MNQSTTSSQISFFFCNSVSRKRNKIKSSRRLTAKKPNKSKELSQGSDIILEKIAM